MLLSAVLCIPLLSPGVPVAELCAQDPAPAAEADAFAELGAEYDAALAGWEETRIGREHPARAYYARFRELADAGDGRAVVWMLANAKAAGLSVIARRSELTRLYLELLEDHVERDFTVGALLALPADARDVDPKRIAAACRLAGGNAESAESRAAAWFALAALRAADGTEAGAGEAEALRLTLMLEYDGTRAAAAVWDVMAEELEKRYWLTPEDERDAIAAELRGLAERGSARARAFLLQAGGGGAEALPWIEDALQERPDAPETLQLAQGLPAFAAAVGEERIEALYRGWLAASESEARRIEVRFELGRFLLEHHAGDEVKGGEALALLEAVRAADPETWGPRVDGEINRLVRLKIGVVAPEIAAETVDGEAFKLSDFRGNVVVLEFWGFW